MSRAQDIIRAIAENPDIGVLVEEVATAKQLEYLKAIHEHGSARAAAAAIGTTKSTLTSRIDDLNRSLIVRGLSVDKTHNFTHVAPEMHVVKGVSSYHKATQDQPAQWVKTSLSHQKFMEHIKAGINAFMENAGPVSVAPPMPATDTDIIPWVQIGDAHIGMLAHEAEVGANFDLKIAEREICAAMAVMINELPQNYERIVIQDCGDFTHYENMGAKTDASGHDLDFDTRFHRMIKVYSRIMRFMVEKALEKAQHVDIIINQGNHSRTNDMWMAELLRVAYGHTGRVHVLNNDSVFIGYRMGNTFVMTHHSDKCRPANLTGVMITDFRKDFGETEYHYIDIGHIHHNMVSKEYPSVQIESWNQLASADKHAHDNGYRSRQSMSVVFRSRTYGELGRKTLPIARVRDMIEQSLGSTYRPKPIEAFTV